MPDHATHPVDLLPELALGVLSAAEAEEVEDILRQCDECRAELEVLRYAVELLPAAAEETEPSPDVRDAVLRSIADEAPEPVPLRPRARRSSTTWAWRGAAAAAAIVLGVVGGFAGYALRGSGDDTARQDAVVEAAGRGDLLVARFEEGGLQTALVRAPGERDAFIWVENLPELPDGKAYQAWFTRDLQEFEPSSVFSTASGGTWLEAEGPVDGYVAMGLTIEDAGGADEPSMAPFVVVELQKSARVKEVPGFMSAEVSP